MIYRSIKKSVIKLRIRRDIIAIFLLSTILPDGFKRNDPTSRLQSVSIRPKSVYRYTVKFGQCGTIRRLRDGRDGRASVRRVMNPRHFDRNVSFDPGLIDLPKGTSLPRIRCVHGENVSPTRLAAVGIRLVIVPEVFVLITSSVTESRADAVQDDAPSKSHRACGVRPDLDGGAKARSRSAPIRLPTTRL